jgi:two-component system sensor histidine kinase RpfC
VTALRIGGCRVVTFESADAMMAALSDTDELGEFIVVDERMLGTDRLAGAIALSQGEAFLSRPMLLLSQMPEAQERGLLSHFLSVLPLPLDAKACEHILRIGNACPCTRGGGAVAPLSMVPAHQALRILVAEDNRTNQLVISQILTRGGHEPVIVENGELAVEALVHEHFDLVFMDLNMPVMNGLEASKFYQFATVGQPRVPIIALTADATEESAQKCREAGMVDCLNKPIEAQRLLALVAQYAALKPRVPLETGAAEGHRRAEAADVATLENAGALEAAEADARQDAGADGPIDERALRDLKALGGDEFVDEIATQFVADAASVLKSLSAAVAEQDVHGFRDHAHALRSCAANVGAQAVYKLCLDLRAIDAQELAVQGEIHVRHLEEEFERAREALSGFLDT